MVERRRKKKSKPKKEQKQKEQGGFFVGIKAFFAPRGNEDEVMDRLMKM